MLLLELLSLGSVFCPPGGMFIDPGILPRLSAENGSGEVHELCHLLKGRDIQSEPLQGDQDVPSAPAARRQW